MCPIIIIADISFVPITNPAIPSPFTQFNYYYSRAYQTATLTPTAPDFFVSNVELGFAPTTLYQLGGPQVIFNPPNPEVTWGNVFGNTLTGYQPLAGGTYILENDEFTVPFYLVSSPSMSQTDIETVCQNVTEGSPYVMIFQDADYVSFKSYWSALYGSFTPLYAKSPTTGVINQYNKSVLNNTLNPISALTGPFTGYVMCNMGPNPIRTTGTL